ncbi:gas vesicle protein GvpG [Wolbachia endosymbiont (group A) of Tiphia femorata]|uniref:gas vesicle protein GvpG n=2 Tax=Wolbachia endosymbiont (group A) of Tiphia femorata TaxID=2954063 RepID=UPI00223251AB|nr:gas vesicle protein GvpG [Wolbachia endosymbiont (group A) of Tiphia femorata]
MKGVKMVESFSGNNEDSNFIEGKKIMENFSDNNENGSSIFQGKIREQDFSAEQKLNELKAAIEKLDRQDLLRRLECERQASSCIDEISSQAELHTEGDDEDYFNGDGERERALGDFWNFFESLFNLFEVDVDDPKIYQMLKEKKEKNLIAAIMKFLRDKLKELIKKIFARDLSFDQRLDKEIKELQEKLNSGELSEEEFARALERLTALQDLKLRLQMAVVGWIVTMFAEMFGVELAAAVEASTEKEDKKAEKTSLKEENKEVCENVEMKVDEREKPKVPVSIFEVSPGFVRPVVLNKPELDLLPESLKIPIDLSHKQVMNNENNKSSQKPEKAEPKEPKMAGYSPAPKPATGTGKVRDEDIRRCDSDWKKKTGQGNNNTYQASSQPAQSFVSDKKASNQYASLVSNGKASNTQNSVIPSKDAPEQSARSSVADCECNFPVGFWNGPENEGSVSNAQPPKGLTNDVKVEKCVEGQSVGKTP